MQTIATSAVTVPVPSGLGTQQLRVTGPYGRGERIAVAGGIGGERRAFTTCLVDRMRHATGGDVLTCPWDQPEQALDQLDTLIDQRSEALDAAGTSAAELAGPPVFVHVQEYSSLVGPRTSPTAERWWGTVLAKAASCGVGFVIELDTPARLPRGTTQAVLLRRATAHEHLLGGDSLNRYRGLAPGEAVVVPLS